jgi:sphingomyelin phosphodiesterase 2
MYRYPLNGRPTAFWRGDWYVGKGVACAKIRYGPAAKQVIEVFNTHTHAPYEGGKLNDSYLCHRTAQSWEMAKLLRGAAERGHLVIAMGDFNMIPMSLEHQLVTALAPVRDAWRVLHPDSSVGPAHHPAEKARRRPVPTAEFNIQENGAASDGPYNTWRWTKAQQKLLGPGKPPVTVPPDTLGMSPLFSGRSGSCSPVLTRYLLKDYLGKRLDYIFAGSGDIRALGGGWVVKRVSVGMMMRHPELGCSLSDHFAVESTLAFHPLRHSHHQHKHTPPASDPNLNNPRPTTTIPPSDDSVPRTTTTTTTTPSPVDSKTDSALHNGAYLQLQSPAPSPTPDSDDPATTAPAPPASQLQSFLHPSCPDNTLPANAYDEILSLIRSYRAREESQLAWRGRHFFASVLVTVACLVAVWFSPRNYVAFVLMLVSSLGLAAGTVDGLMALLFFRSELKALREFEWEVRNAKGFILSGAVGGGGGGGGEVLEEEEWAED